MFKKYLFALCVSLSNCYIISSESSTSLSKKARVDSVNNQEEQLNIFDIVLRIQAALNTQNFSNIDKGLWSKIQKYAIGNEDVIKQLDDLINKKEWDQVRAFLKKYSCMLDSLQKNTYREVKEKLIEYITHVSPDITDVSTEIKKYLDSLKGDILKKSDRLADVYTGHPQLNERSL